MENQNTAESSVGQPFESSGTLSQKKLCGTLLLKTFSIIYYKLVIASVRNEGRFEVLFLKYTLAFLRRSFGIFAIIRVLSSHACKDKNCQKEKKNIQLIYSLTRET
jgi:hypothetical protein